MLSDADTTNLSNMDVLDESVFEDSSVTAFDLDAARAIGSSVVTQKLTRFRKTPLVSAFPWRDSRRLSLTPFGLDVNLPSRIRQWSFQIQGRQLQKSSNREGRTTARLRFAFPTLNPFSRR